MLRALGFRRPILFRGLGFRRPILPQPVLGICIHLYKKETAREREREMERERETDRERGRENEKRLLRLV